MSVRRVGAHFAIAMSVVTPVLALTPPWLGQVAAAKEAARHVGAPDIEDMWVTIIGSISRKAALDPRHVVSPTPVIWYVSVTAPGGSAVDPPPDVLARARIPGVWIKPGSQAPEMERRVGGETRYEIGEPLHREDGNYDVTYSYNCGALCAAGFNLVMSHDEHGWHILSNQLDWIS